MSQASSPRQKQLFGLFVIALLIAGVALNPCLDVDTWWHLRVGQFIVSERTLPTQDPFSQLGQREHAPWLAYSWLYELGLYGAFQGAGFDGISFCRLLLDGLSFCAVAWVLFRQASNNWLALGTLALVTIALLPLSTERPWHITICFTALTLHAVLAIHDGLSAWQFRWLPLVYVVWANIHIQFVLGIGLLGLAWCALLIETLLARRRTPPTRRDAATAPTSVEVKKMTSPLVGEVASLGSPVGGNPHTQLRGLFLLGLACGLATLVTPFHVRLFVVIWEYATQTGALRLVTELMPADFAVWWNWPLLVLMPVAAVGVWWRGCSLCDLLLLGAGLVFSLRMQRDVWFGVLIAGTLVVRNFGVPTKDETRLGAGSIVLAFLAAVLFARCLWELGGSQGRTFSACHETTYPVGAAEYVRRHALPGPLFNTFDWGGYLIWTLPDYPVSIDGRTNFYGEARLERCIRTWMALDWDADLDLQRARLVIAPQRKGIEATPLTEELRLSPQWKLVYEDATAVVFVRTAEP